jgi:hypothetical protein
MGNRDATKVDSNRFYKLFVLLGITLLCSACGYRVRGAAAELPAGIQSIGIPTFANNASQYKIEQLITAAVLDEFRIRTRAPVNSNRSGVDSVLLGEIRDVDSDPVAYGTQKIGNRTFGSAYVVTVRASVKWVRSSDSAVLWQNENFIIRERYVLNSNIQDFFSEENPALDRLAKDLARRLASSILDQQTQ